MEVGFVSGSKLTSGTIGSTGARGETYEHSDLAGLESSAGSEQVNSVGSARAGSAAPVVSVCLHQRCLHLGFVV